MAKQTAGKYDTNRQIARRAFFAAWLAAAVIGNTFFAAASSPDFARSEEEWAALRDNKLTFEEIPALVHEYNATVLNNEKAFQKDSGQNAEEIREALLDAADEMDNLAMDAETEGGAGYATGAGYRTQAASLRQQAEESVSDSDVIRWQYEQVEASIVQSVKTNFISYYEAILQKAAGEAKIGYLEQAYQSALNKKNVGTATELEVLTAKESLQTAQAALLSADASISSYKRKMQVLCGWEYDADAEIGALPDFDMALISEIDLSADTELALSNNYQLKIDERKLKNATDGTLRAQYQKTVDTDRQQIASSVRSAYDSLITAKSDYDTAAAELALSRQSLDTSARQYALGVISRMEYAAAENAVTEQEHALKLSEIAVFSAWTAYESAVGGLASAGTSA